MNNINLISIRSEKFLAAFVEKTFPGGAVYLQKRVWGLIEKWDKEAFFKQIMKCLFQAGYGFMPAEEAISWYESLTPAERMQVLAQEKFGNQEYPSDRELLYAGFKEDGVGVVFSHLRIPPLGARVDSVKWSKEVILQGVFLVKKM